VTLHQARVAALKVFAARAEGKDPAAEKQQARRRLVADRVDDLVERFIAEHLSKKRSACEISRLLRREVIPKWGMRSVHEIGKRQVSELSELTARGAPSAANKLLKVLKIFFGWCVGRAILDVSPAKDLAAPAQETARDRVLNDDELVRILRACRQMNGPYGGIVELLALTGQRREEVAQLVWDEIDLAGQTWTLPASRSKNGKPHIVQLSKAAISVLMRMPRLGRFVFSLSGLRSFQNFSAAKRELDKLSQVTSWRLWPDRYFVPGEVRGYCTIGAPSRVGGDGAMVSGAGGL
jgi:integrase